MSVTQSEKARKFRALHRLPAAVGATIGAARPGAFIIPNPWDAGSARILAGMGFEALATTSSGFAYSLGNRPGGGAEFLLWLPLRQENAANLFPSQAARI